MKKANYLFLSILFLAACQPVEQDLPQKEDPEEIVEVADSVWSLTLIADKGDADTKALYMSEDENGVKLNSYWRSSETVKVYKGTSWIGTLEVTPGAGDKPARATLSGSITVNGLADGDQLTLMIPRDTWSYEGQNGSLETLQDNYDYALATVTVSAVDIENQAISTTDAHFENQQSIYQFAFKDNNNVALSVKEFTMRSTSQQALVITRVLGANGWTSTTGILTVKPAAATAEPLFVSLRNEMPAPSAAEVDARTVVDTYGFVITGANDALYLATKGIPAHVLDVPGKFIGAGITAVQPDFSPASGEISDPGAVL